MPNEQHLSAASEPVDTPANRQRLSAGSDPVDTTATVARREQLRRQEQQLIAMKETGPKSAAWQRARLMTLWRIQRRLRQLDDEA